MASKITELLNIVLLLYLHEILQFVYHIATREQNLYIG